MILLLPLQLVSCSPFRAQKAGTSAETKQEAERIIADSELSAAADRLTVNKNPDKELSVPTYITKISGVYFIVDCYHDQIIYSSSLSAPLSDWLVMTDEIKRGHTLAGDGTVYLADDTENNRILIFEKYDDKFIHTQTLDNIGIRPHYIIYNKKDSTFYAWSSMTGEMYLIRRHHDSTGVYIAGTRRIDSLNGIYVRSFTIDAAHDRIYFVSGNSSVIQARLSDFKIEKEYPVPDTMAGMVQITPIGRQFYITISTDSKMDQKYATIIRCRSLSDLSSGKYEDIYSDFIGGGTPYYITKIDSTYYLTEHRISGHSIWSFNVISGKIEDIRTVF